MTLRTNVCFRETPSMTYKFPRESMVSDRKEIPEEGREEVQEGEGGGGSRRESRRERVEESRGERRRERDGRERETPSERQAGRQLVGEKGEKEAEAEEDRKGG